MITKPDSKSSWNPNLGQEVEQMLRWLQSSTSIRTGKATYTKDGATGTYHYFVSSYLSTISLRPQRQQQQQQMNDGSDNNHSNDSSASSFSSNDSSTMMKSNSMYNADLRQVIRNGYASLTHTAEQIQQKAVTQRPLLDNVASMSTLLLSSSLSPIANASLLSLDRKSYQDDSNSIGEYTDTDADALKVSSSSSSSSSSLFSPSAETIQIQCSIQECLEEMMLETSGKSINNDNNNNNNSFTNNHDNTPFIVHGAPLTITRVDIQPPPLSLATISLSQKNLKPDRVHVYWTLPAHLWLNVHLTKTQKQQLVQSIDHILTSKSTSNKPMNNSSHNKSNDSNKGLRKNHYRHNNGQAWNGPLTFLLRRLERKLHAYYGTGSRHKPYPIFYFLPEPNPEEYFIN
jgi:hypothetical protein